MPSTQAPAGLLKLYCAQCQKDLPPGTAVCSCGQLGKERSIGFPRARFWGIGLACLLIYGMFRLFGFGINVFADYHADLRRFTARILSVACILLTGLLISLSPAKYRRVAIVLGTAVLILAFLGVLVWYFELLPGKRKVFEAPAKMEIMESFALRYPGGQARAADLADLRVQFRNNGPAPVLVALVLALDHPEMAIFEIEDDKGRRTEAAADVLRQKSTDIRHIVAVPAHDSAELFRGGKRLADAVSKPGTYRMRFAYDATLGSDYRRGVSASDGSALLPPVRLVSNTVTFTITE